VRLCALGDSTDACVFLKLWVMGIGPSWGVGIPAKCAGGMVELCVRLCWGVLWVCPTADLFIPTYDGPSNFANNVIGQRMYSGFLGTVRPDRKALAQLVGERKKGNLDDRASSWRCARWCTRCPWSARTRACCTTSTSTTSPSSPTPGPSASARTRRTTEDAFSQHPETGGFERSCPTG